MTAKPPKIPLNPPLKGENFLKLTPVREGGNPDFYPEWHEVAFSLDSGSALRCARNDRMEAIIYNKITTRLFIPEFNS